MFSRRPDFQMEHLDVHLTPLPVSDEVSSLSAIMLDDDYYNLMLTGRKTVDGVSVLGAEYLIVFKVKAFLHLHQKKADGLHVNERDLKKHRNDVFLLLAAVDPTQRIALPAKVRDKMTKFLQIITEQPVKLRDLGLDGFALEDVWNGIRGIYGIRG